MHFERVEFRCFRTGRAVLRSPQLPTQSIRGSLGGLAWLQWPAPKRQLPLGTTQALTSSRRPGRDPQRPLSPPLRAFVAEGFLLPKAFSPPSLSLGVFGAGSLRVESLHLIGATFATGFNIKNTFNKWQQYGVSIGASIGSPK